MKFYCSAELYTRRETKNVIAFLPLFPQRFSEAKFILQNQELSLTLGELSCFVPPPAFRSELSCESGEKGKNFACGARSTGLFFILLAAVFKEQEQTKLQILCIKLRFNFIKKLPALQRGMNI